VVKSSHIDVRINKNVVRLDISVNIAQKVEFLDKFNHLNAEFENIHFLEVFLVFVENCVHTFTKLVLKHKLRFVFDLLDLVSVLNFGFAPVFKLRKTLRT